MSRDGGSLRTLPTITHDITEYAKWPAAAKPIVDLLCRPLSSTIADPTRMPGPGWPREAWTRVLRDIDMRLANISTQPSPVTGSRERLVTDPRIFDTLWAHAERMRYFVANPRAVSRGTPPEEMPTRATWTALMKQLLEASVSHEESILWHNTPFILPRPNRLSASIPLSRTCEDEAAMLFVTHIQELLITSSDEGSRHPIQNQAPLQQQNPNKPPIPGRSGVPVKKETADLSIPTTSPPRRSTKTDGISEKVKSEEWSSESDEIITVNSEVEVLKLDVSLDGHVVPGAPVQNTCVLPIVCVAGDGPGLSNITSQITSVACQRYVWGIHQPTLGIEMADSGYHARIFIAWVQEEEMAPVRGSPGAARLPTSVGGLTGPGVVAPPPNMKRVVHIARASTSSAFNQSIGLFNLALPAHMVLFAQFIMGAARAQYDGIVGATMSYADYEDRVPVWRRKFCWRSDHGAITGEMHGMMPTDNTLEGRIRKWAEEVEVYRLEGTDPKAKGGAREGTTGRRQRRATSRPL